MSKKPFSLQSEAEAMKTIAGVLEELPKESQERIANWLLSIVNIAKTPSTSLHSEQDYPAPVNIVGSVYQKEEHIKEFFQAKKPKNNYQKLALLGYYLEFMKGKDEFNLYPYPLSRQKTGVFKVDSSPFVKAVGTKGARRATGVPTATSP